MGDAARNSGLGIIFSFFLGLMVTAFFGIGVFTIYPYPTEYSDAIMDSYRQEQEIRGGKSSSQLTDEERAQLQAISDEREELQETQRRLVERRNRNLAILLTTLATLTMAVSLIRSQALPVVSNGLLLGGLFTMLFGIGWIITDNSPERLIVVTVALAATLVLGYIRFVRQRPQAQPAAPVSVGAGAGPTTGESLDLASIERRLQAIERRLDEAAYALKEDSDPKDRK